MPQTRDRVQPDTPPGTMIVHYMNGAEDSWLPKAIYVAVGPHLLEGAIKLREFKHGGRTASSAIRVMYVDDFRIWDGGEEE